MMAAPAALGNLRSTGTCISSRAGLRVRLIRSYHRHDVSTMPQAVMSTATFFLKTLQLDKARFCRFALLFHT
jgi:hypothetical protein